MRFFIHPFCSLFGPFLRCCCFFHHFCFDQNVVCAFTEMAINSFFLVDFWLFSNGPNGGGSSRSHHQTLLGPLRYIKDVKIKRKLRTLLILNPHFAVGVRSSSVLINEWFVIPFPHSIFHHIFYVTKTCLAVQWICFYLNIPNTNADVKNNIKNCDK